MVRCQEALRGASCLHFASDTPVPVHGEKRLPLGLRVVRTLADLRPALLAPLRQPAGIRLAPGGLIRPAPVTIGRIPLTAQLQVPLPIPESPLPGMRIRPLAIRRAPEAVGHPRSFPVFGFPSARSGSTAFLAFLIEPIRVGGMPVVLGQELGLPTIGARFLYGDHHLRS
jgi:hypothetical protein